MKIKNHTQNSKHRSDNTRKETEYIMKSPAMINVIRKGKKEIAAGGGKTVNIDELWNSGSYDNIR